MSSKGRTSAVISLKIIAIKCSCNVAEFDDRQNYAVFLSLIVVPHDALAHHAFLRPVETCREIRAMGNENS